MRRILTGLLSAALLLSHVGVAVAQTTPAGTVISNAAQATYSDGTSNYQTQSNTVTITVQSVTTASIVAVTSAQNVAPNQLVDDQYQLNNTGNSTGKFTTITTAVNGGNVATIASYIFTPVVGGVAGAAVPCPNATNTTLTACITYAQGLSVNSGDSLKVDVIYADGNYVQATGATTTVGSTMNATLTYTANGGSTITPTGAAITNTIQADAIVDVQKSVAPITNASQNIAYTITAANRGYFSTQPLNLSSTIGSSLPAQGIVISDPIASNFSANTTDHRFVSLSVSGTNGVNGALALYYTTAAAPFSSTTAWTLIPTTAGAATAAAISALNATTGITSIIAVLSGNTSGLNGTSSAAHGVSTGPGAVTTPQLTLNLAFTQKSGETGVKNLADSAIGNNAEPNVPGTLASLVVGPASAGPQTATASSVSADIANTSASPAGPGYSNQTSTDSVTAALLLGPGGQPGALGAFSPTAGASALWESGAPTTANDYSAAGLLAGTIVNTSATGPGSYTLTVPGSPAITAIKQTVKNNGNVVDAFAITSVPFGNTTIGVGAWTLTFAATAAGCAAGTPTYTTANVAVAATADFYSCWTPPAGSTLSAATPYGAAIKASSTAGSASDTSYDALFPGGFVTLQKSIVSTSGTPSNASAGSCAAAATFTAGCVINYQIQYSVVLPKGSGSNNASPTGALGFQLQEDGVNGINASVGGKNNWGTVGALSGTPTATGALGSGTITYFTAGSPFAVTGNGAGTGTVGTAPPASCTGFRIDLATLPFGATGTGVVSFSVKVN